MALQPMPWVLDNPNLDRGGNVMSRERPGKTFNIQGTFPCREMSGPSSIQSRRRSWNQEGRKGKYPQIAPLEVLPAIYASKLSEEGKKKKLFFFFLLYSELAVFFFSFSPIKDLLSTFTDFVKSLPSVIFFLPFVYVFFIWLYLFKMSAFWLSYV